MKKVVLFLIFCSLSANYLYADWAKLNSHTSTTIRDILISGNVVYTATGTGVFKSTDGTASWLAVNDGLVNQFATDCSMIKLINNTLYLSCRDGIYKSTNSGSNWVKKSNGIVVGNGSLYADCESIFENGGVLYTGSWTGIYRSTDFGETWNPTNITGSSIRVCYFINYDGTLFAAKEAGSGPGSYKSTDNGITWSVFSIGSNVPAITFYDDGPRFYAGTIHGVWLSINSGVSWVMKNTGLTADPYSTSIIRVNNTLVTSLKFGGSGMFKSFNNGDSWIDFRQGLPFLSEINIIIQFNNKILAGTSGGIYQRDVSELTGINIISNEVPDNYVLFQNYPNPFNPETKIKFNIPLLKGVSEGRGVLTSLVIYDILGSEVAALVKEQLQPGTYEVTFDGSNLPSGVYYYRITTGEFNDVKKMILVK